MDHVAGTGLYEFVPSEDGLDLIKQAMRINLELEQEKYKKSFSFTIDKPYEPEIIGEDEWGGVKSYPSAPTSGGDETPEDTDSKKISCEAPLEPTADNSSCICPTWNGYEEDDSGCVKKEEKPTEEPCDDGSLPLDHDDGVCPSDPVDPTPEPEPEPEPEP